MRQLPSGHLIVTGRDKDHINRAGEKISPEELEGLTLTHRAILDAVAVAVPDSYLGERIALIIRLQPNATLPDLRTYLAKCGLSPAKLPDEVRVVSEFPATAVGKNSRKQLRRILSTSQGESS